MHVCVFPYRVDRPKGEVLISFQAIKSLLVTDSDNGADNRAPAAGLCGQRWLVLAGRPVGRCAVVD